MANSKKLTVKDIRAHLFMSIVGNHVDLIYHDDYDNGAGLGAALSSVMEEDDKLFDIISAALLTACETRDNNPNWEKVKILKKEKDISKTPKKAVKTPVKAAKRK
jgi:hypothetical protein